MNRTIATAASVAIFALSAPPANAQPGPVGQWRLDEGAGSVATDSSGGGDNGKILGGASWTKSGGRAGLSFAGTNGEVSVPDAPQLEPASTVSVGAWVLRSGSPGNYKYILAKGGHGCIAASYGLYSGPSGGLEFYISRGQGSVYARSPDAGQTVWNGQWHLVVGTFDGTTLRLYVDGNEVGAGTQYPGPLEYLLSDANNLLVGDYPSCAGEDFSGTISGVSIWDRALSASEVTALAHPTQPFTPVGGSQPGFSTSPTGGDPGGSTNGPTSDGTAQMSTPPVIRGLVISPSTIGLRIGKRFASIPTISYSDSASSRVTFTILRIQPRPARARCIKDATRRHLSADRYCPPYISLSAFTQHASRGHNRVKFARAFALQPGSYVLDATPAVGGDVGTTVGVKFNVVLRRSSVTH